MVGFCSGFNETTLRWIDTIMRTTLQSDWQVTGAQPIFLYPIGSRSGVRYLAFVLI